jgi:phospholipid/cholesterol/gamma-HCH transport system substrate-binding protein
MIERFLEIFIGSFVVVIAILFLTFSLGSRNDLANKDSYRLSARYNNIGELKKGDNIKISGVPIGQVYKISLDEKNYEAIATFLIDSSVQLPIDSTAQILLGGIFGNTEVRIIPGKNTQTLEPHAEITNTTDAINLEDLIGEFIYNSTESSP